MEGNTTVPSVADSDEEDVFEDASQLFPSFEKMDLSTSIMECQKALHLFLNNHFEASKSLLEPWADKSMYHGLGYCTILYMQAAMTFEATDIENAVKVTKRTIRICNQQRRKMSFLNSIGKINYDKYTSEEIHAELCYAEALLERALLTFIQDENLINFVKGSLKIKHCHTSYKECVKVLEKRSFSENDEIANFESGVRMGNGMFNLLISLLPTKILRLLEYVGFSGNKAKGLVDLEAGSRLENSIRGPLCALGLLSYHTVVTYLLGTADGDLQLCDNLLDVWLQKFPKGALFLFFAGRVEEIKGNIVQGIRRFEECIDAQQEWKQFHHLCYWELMWSHSYINDWLMAMKYAEILCKESRWSRATYTYQKASFLLMCDNQTQDTAAHLSYLFREIPKLKQRLAGKSLPIEKFAVKKSQRYFAQNERLTLPAYELIYVWNGFAIIGKNPRLLEPMLEKIENTINDLVKNKDKMKFYTDDYCLALLLKGVCLRCMEKYLQAEQCFSEVISLEKKITEDTYLIPYAHVELALLFLFLEKWQDARALLERVKDKYKGYSLESRLHFRIHAIVLRLNSSQPDVAAAKANTCSHNDSSSQEQNGASSSKSSEDFFEANY